MTRSDPTLRRFYNLYNRKYFNSELPDDAVIFWEPMPDKFGECEVQHRECFFIAIDEAIKQWPTLWKMKLLHEMSHISSWHKDRSDHGKHFQGEMLRLAVAGAFKNLW